MQAQSRRDTAPELRIRRELHRRGLRFRVDQSPVAGLRTRADIVFGASRVAVFVNGCFWHQCPVHGTVPKNNREWWTAKLRANVERDARADDLLHQAGWVSLRFWEHDDVMSAAEAIEILVRARRPSGRA